MIISHKHKFIFIKTNKTAGTSVEIALSKFCGPTDTITPITPKDEATRQALGYRGPQNYLMPLNGYSARDWLNLLLKGKRRRRFYHHMSALEVKQHVDGKTWQDYFKFCIERNPWDRVISLYYWYHQSEPRPTISEFLASNAPQFLKRRGFDLYTIDDKIVVDKILHFENLSDELEALRIQVGIPQVLELPRAKAGFRQDRRGYRDILNKSEEMAIAKLFADEIAHLGYQF